MYYILAHCKFYNDYDWDWAYMWGKYWHKTILLTSAALCVDCFKLIIKIFRHLGIPSRNAI